MYGIIILEPPPPPADIQLRKASQDQLVFTWTPGVESCQAVRYIINSTNCGSCPSTTDSTFITCENLNLTSIKRVCSLNIRTVVCDDLIDENGRTLQITTKGMIVFHNISSIVFNIHTNHFNHSAKCSNQCENYTNLPLQP